MGRMLGCGVFNRKAKIMASCKRQGANSGCSFVYPSASYWGITAMITDQKLEAALKYIAETDELHATAKQHLLTMEQDIKTQKAIAFEEMTGSATEKNAKLYNCENVKQSIKSWGQCVFDYQLLENKRKRAFITIEVYRTQSANARQGHV